MEYTAEIETSEHESAMSTRKIDEDDREERGDRHIKQNISDTRCSHDGLIELHINHRRF